MTIIGAGPAGLATALMLAQRGMTDIHVYERLPAPPTASKDTTAVWDDDADAIAKYYLIGLGGRGQKALQMLDQERATNTTAATAATTTTTTTDTARVAAGRTTRKKTVWQTVDYNTVTVRGRKDWAPGAGIDEGT